MQRSHEYSYLRRGLKILGYTNKTLAKALSDVRTDNECTSESTVSRWVTGNAPMPAGVLLFFKNALIKKYAETRPPRLAATYVVAVGGGKGGCGGSTISAALAVAARDNGFRVRHVTLGQDCNNSYFRRHVASDFQQIYVPDMKLSAELMRGVDFVFLDVPSRTYASQSMPKELKDAVNLFVLPINIAQRIDLETGLSACQGLGKTAPILLVQSTSLMDIKALARNFKAVEPWNDVLYEQPVYVDDPIRYEAGIWPKWEFSSSEAEIAYQELFQQVCERTAGHSGVRLSEYDLELLTIPELVDLLSPSSEQNGVDQAIQSLLFSTDKND